MTVDAPLASPQVPGGPVGPRPVPELVTLPGGTPDAVLGAGAAIALAVRSAPVAAPAPPGVPTAPRRTTPLGPRARPPSRPDVLRPAVVLGVVLGVSVLVGHIAGTQGRVLVHDKMLPWILGRSLGVATYVALTAMVVLGLWLRHPWRGRFRRPRPESILWAHVTLAACTVALLAGHLTSLALDRYAGVGWTGVFVPWGAQFKPTGVAIGTLALYDAGAGGGHRRPRRVDRTGRLVPHPHGLGRRVLPVPRPRRARRERQRGVAVGLRRVRGHGPGPPVHPLARRHPPARTRRRGHVTAVPVLAGAPEADAPARPRVGGIGDPGTVLLRGPAAGTGGGGLDGHLATWGALPVVDGSGVRALLRSSGLDGRGGGGFPLGRKVETARLATGRTVLVVNAGESEPVSRKDRTLCTERPHLVLDGAALVAAALEVDEVVVHLHRSSGSPAAVLEAAVADRRRRGPADPGWRISTGPDRYVAGESSAVASFVDGGEARPRFTTLPLAVVGPSGRPTVVTNAETVAHLAVLARIGPDEWAAHGVPSSPGPRLVTVTGAVARPGRVYELTGPVTIGDVLAADGVAAPPAAVLVGGFAGAWVRGDEAWQTPFSREALRCVDAAPGCGLLGVLPHGACGLVETSRIVRYLAGESAGQCGTCVAGLPRLASAWEALAGGTLRRRGLRRMAALADTVLGSGACGHPDGVVRLIHSTLAAFEDDVIGHLAGHPCRGSDHPGARRAGGVARHRPGRRPGVEMERGDPHRPDPLPGARHLRAVLRRRCRPRPVGVRQGGGLDGGLAGRRPPRPAGGGGVSQPRVRCPGAHSATGGGGHDRRPHCRPCRLTSLPARSIASGRRHNYAPVRSGRTCRGGGAARRGQRWITPDRGDTEMGEP